jgi:hypothetical protein
MLNWGNISSPKRSVVVAWRPSTKPTNLATCGNIVTGPLADGEFGTPDTHCRASAGTATDTGASAGAATDTAATDIDTAAADAGAGTADTDAAADIGCAHAAHAHAAKVICIGKHALHSWFPLEVTIDGKTSEVWVVEAL